MISKFAHLFERARTEQSLPGNLRGGVHRNLPGPGQVTSVLRAPHKPFASLVGDFNNWDTRRHPMQTDGSGTWWVTLPDPGRTRYGYYVLVDDDTHVWIGDPLQPGFNPYHGIAAICWAARQAKPDYILIGEFWQLEGTHCEKSAARLVQETEMDVV